MDKKVERRNKAGDTDPGTPRRFIHDKPVMVKAQTRANVPLTQPNLVLHVGGGFYIPAAIGELKLQLCAWIKQESGSNLIRIDLILQRFAHGTEHSVGANLPLVPAMIAGEIRADIAFTVAPVLRDYNGSGIRIGRKQGRGVAHAG